MLHRDDILHALHAQGPEEQWADAEPSMRTAAESFHLVGSFHRSEPAGRLKAQGLCALIRVCTAAKHTVLSV